MSQPLKLHTTVDAGRHPSVASLADEVLGAWRSSKIVHIRQPRPDGSLHAFYDALLSAIGEPAHFAEDATAGDREHQRTGEVWMEVRYDSKIPDAYRHSANAQPLHTDGSYIPSFPNATFMYAVRSAPSGGETVFLDSRVLAEVLRARDPGLLSALTTTVIPHARSGDRRELPALRSVGDDWLVNWNYYCVAADAPPEVVALRERFFAFLRDEPSVRAALLPVLLRDHDAVVWHDALVLHGRNAFEPGEGPSRFLWKCAVEVGAA